MKKNTEELEFNFSPEFQAVLNGKISLLSFIDWATINCVNAVLKDSILRMKSETNKKKKAKLLIECLKGAESLKGLQEDFENKHKKTH